MIPRATWRPSTRTSPSSGCRTSGHVTAWPGESRGAGREMALLGDAQGAAGRLQIVRMCGFRVTGHLEQVGPDGLVPVVPGERGFGLHRCKLSQTLLGTLNQGHLNDPVEGDHGSGGDAPQQVVQAKDLRPVGVLEPGRLVVHRGYRSLKLVGPDRPGG